MSNISSLQLSRHYEAHSVRAGRVVENLETLRERIQRDIATVVGQRAEAIKALAVAYLPALEPDALASAEQRTGFRGFTRRDPMAAMAKELQSLRKRVTRIQADERYVRRTYLVGEHGELTRELAERQSLLEPWSRECSRFEDLEGFTELVESRYDTPDYDQSFFSARYWKLWAAGDRICDALGMSDFGDDVLPAYAKAAAERLKWVRQVEEVQAKVDAVHSLVQQHDEAVALQPRLPGMVLDQCHTALSQHLKHADVGLLQTWLGDPPDRAVMLVLRRAAGLAAKEEFLSELVEGLDAQLSQVMQRRGKYMRKAQKYTRSKYMGHHWGPEHQDAKFEAKAAKMHTNLEKVEVLADRMMAYDDYGRFDLENDPELWWVEFTRKRPSRLTPRLRSWYDRNPNRQPQLDVDDHHARALASAVAAREENDALGYIS